jgi:hypothetical protein
MISDETYTAIVLVVLMSILISPPLLRMTLDRKNKEASESEELSKQGRFPSSAETRTRSVSDTSYFTHNYTAEEI